MWDASVQGQQAPLFIDRRFSLLSCLNFYGSFELKMMIMNAKEDKFPDL